MLGVVVERRRLGDNLQILFGNTLGASLGSCRAHPLMRGWGWLWAAGWGSWGWGWLWGGVTVVVDVVEVVGAW